MFGGKDTVVLGRPLGITTDILVGCIGGAWEHAVVELFDDRTIPLKGQPQGFLRGQRVLFFYESPDAKELWDEVGACEAGMIFVMIDPEAVAFVSESHAVVEACVEALKAHRAEFGPG